MMAKVKYTKQLDDGRLKRVNEMYLLSAVSFTDAEARIYEELGTIIKGEFSITNITPVDIHDIFAYDDADTWYRAKVRYEGIDGNSEKPKMINQTMLVSANSLKEADQRINDELKSLLHSFDIHEIKETKIVEIFPYDTIEVEK